LVNFLGKLLKSLDKNMINFVMFSAATAAAKHIFTARVGLPASFPSYDVQGQDPGP
jgi:hypothetical protein